MSRVMGERATRGSVTMKRRKRVKAATDETTVHAVVLYPDNDESSNHRA
jgi:hypothetical protein